MGGGSKHDGGCVQNKIFCPYFQVYFIDLLKVNKILGQ